jgi:hypothetical protein
MASNYDLSIVQGDTLRWSMYLTGDGGTAYNLGGATLSMQVRKGYYPSSLLASYSSYISPAGNSDINYPEGYIGGLSASATGGTIYISIGATYTGLLSSDSTSKYDIQVVHPNTNMVLTILRGAITGIPEVTKLQ